MGKVTESHGYIKIERPVLGRVQFDELCAPKVREETTFLEGFKQMIKKCTCTAKCTKKCCMSFLGKSFPFTKTLCEYDFKKNILSDIFAGVSVGMVHIPQGMGFALLAAVPPVYGLYSSFYPGLLYFLFGTSNHISVGTMAVISLVVGEVVEREIDLFIAEKSLNRNVTFFQESSTSVISVFTENMTTQNWLDSKEFEEEVDIYRASIASAVSLVAGGFMFVMGVLRLGVIKTFMSRSFTGGFTTGAAFHIVTTQLKGMLSLHVTKYVGFAYIPKTWHALAVKLPETSVPTIILSIITVAFLTFLKEFINTRYRSKLPIPIPAELLALVFGILFSYLFDFNQRWGINIVGVLPKGLPPPSIPPLERATHFAIEAFIAGLLCFAISISMADLFARKHNYKIDKNQELIANGLCYGVSAFFHCFIGASAPPRCFVQEATGGKTQVASLVSSSVLLLVIMVLSPFCATLPRAILSCIITVALFPLFRQFTELPKLWRVNKADFSIWLVTFFTSVFFDLPYGLGIGITWSIFTVPILALLEKGITFGETKYRHLYAPTNTYQNVEIKKGIVIFKFENNLYFPTIDNFKKQLFEATIDPSLLVKSPICIQDGIEIGNIAYPSFAKDPSAFGKTFNIHRMFFTQSNETNIESRKIANTNDIKINVKAKSKDQTGIKVIIMDCSSIAYIDYMGLNCLKDLKYSYREAEINFILAACSQSLLRKLELDGQIRGVNGDVQSVYPTVIDAVESSENTIVNQTKV